MCLVAPESTTQTLLSPIALYDLDIHAFPEAEGSVSLYESGGGFVAVDLPTRACDP